MNADDVDARLETWFTELARLAKQRDLEWLVRAGPAAHRAAFLSGASPEEELTALADMSEWRGCGCGA